MTCRTRRPRRRRRRRQQRRRSAAFAILSSHKRRVEWSEEERPHSAKHGSRKDRRGREEEGLMEFPVSCASRAEGDTRDDMRDGDRAPRRWQHGGKEGKREREKAEASPVSCSCLRLLIPRVHSLTHTWPWPVIPQGEEGGHGV